MKSIGTVLLAGMMFLPSLLKAQALQPAPDSVVQIAADMAGLPLVPPAQVPPFGTFWLLSPGGISGIIAAPLPCPPIDPTLPVYAVTPFGEYLVDDTHGQVLPNAPSGQTVTSATASSAVSAQANAVANLITEIQTAQVNPDTGTQLAPNGLTGGADSPLVLDPDQLWLEMVAVTNQTASLVIHPPAGVSNEVYELLYSTNLLTPLTNWQWVLRSYPNDTNLIVPNASDAQGFYRLGQPDDFVANDSLGTNFWLAFPRLPVEVEPYYGYYQLSLAISSPVGATGTVTAPDLIGNGPVLLVTNCADTALNGTYVQTNLPVAYQQNWAFIGFSPLATSYVMGTNWVISEINRDICYLIAGAGYNFTILYSKTGANLNGSADEWQASIWETNPPPAPTTVCAQAPLVNQAFTLAAGEVTNISSLRVALMQDFDVVGSNGIHVVASQPVSVYGLAYGRYGSTAFTGYPVKFLGTNYCVLARASLVSSYHSQLMVVAAEDNTSITITPSPTAYLDNHDSPYVINLSQGGTYQIISLDYYIGDVTGTWVQADKPIAVFAGDDTAYMPDGNTQAGNPLVQEQIPVESWGMQALSVGFAGRTNGDSYRVLAANNDTTITITGKVVTVENETVSPWSVTESNEVVVITNQAGQFYDIIVDGPVQFQASHPIQVAQFANGNDFDKASSSQNYQAEGDPCEILLPPIGHYLETNVIVTGPGLDFSNYPPSGFDENYLNLVVTESAVTNVLLDGIPVAATNFVAVGTSGYFGAQLFVTNGVHTVTCSQPIGVEVYGFGNYDAYGYFGGIVK